MITTKKILEFKSLAEKGFSLLEVVIAMMFASMILILAFQQFMPWFQFRQKIETERKMENIRGAIEAAYRANAGLFDGTDTSTSEGGVITIPSTPPLTFQTSCPENMRDPDQEKHFYSVLMDYLPLSDAGPEAFVDGFGATFCIGVSVIKSWSVDGVNIPYRNIVIVSKGMNNILDVNNGPHPFDPLNGIYSPIDGSDDTVASVQGINIQQEKYQLAVSRLERVAEAYSVHYLLNFLRNPTRDLTLNYFYCDTPSNTPGNACASTSTGGVVAGVDGITIEDSNTALVKELSVVLGLSPDDFKNPWYQSSASPEKAYVRVNNLPTAMCASTPCTTPDKPPYSIRVMVEHPNPGNHPGILSRTGLSRYE